jgi:PDZ domain-containing secreted protein
LLTGDQVRTVNGRRITSDAELRAALAGLRIGDQAIVEVQRDGVGEPVTTRVPVTGYERTTVTVVELPVVTERMRRLRAIWLTGSSVAR